MTIHKLTKLEKEKVKEIISNILKRKDEILFSYILGSFLENGFKRIDTAVYLKDVERFLKYELSLEREIEDAINFPVDVMIFNHALLSFRFNVIKNGLLPFSKDENIVCDFESLSIVEYHDLDYLMNDYRSEALAIEV